MQLSANSLASVPNWIDLPLAHAPTPSQLDNIQKHLDLVLLALESLINIDAEVILQVALDLDINTAIAQEFKLWRNRIPNSPEGNGWPQNKLGVEQARSLVLIICHLAQKNREFIRRAVTLLEQTTADNRDPYRTTLLGNYFETFNTLYQAATLEANRFPPSQLSQLAFKLLVDLLFYSATHGHHRLWLALLDYTR